MTTDALIAPPARQSAARGAQLDAATLLFALDLMAAMAWLLQALAVLPAEARPDPAHLLAYPALWLLFLYALGFYRRDALLETRRMLGRLPLAAALSTAVAASASLLPLPGEPGHVPVLVGNALLGLTLAGALARIALAGLRGAGVCKRRVLVIGAGRRAWDLALLLRREGRAGAYDFAFAHHPAMGEVDPRLTADTAAPVLPASSDFLALARGFGADQVVVAPDERRGLDMRALLDCRIAGYPVVDYLSVLEREIGRVDLKRLELGWLLFAQGFDAGALDRAAKRVVDVVVSLAVLLLTGPFLAAAALAVKLQDGGPALYRQNRVTQGGRVFSIMKLRTMRIDAEKKGATWAQQGDPRVTATGRFLRRTRLDELPQLINVLRGDMSFVGPRPERPEFTRELAAQLPLYEERHRVRAGLTGWAQVNYPYGASLDDARSKLSYDLYYVKNFSVLLDLRIILQTLRVVLWPGSGVR
ncbi:TIGR03013 family XrtA/PEP-CTERM system glycosyltransferase [Paracraurococcus ruber]|uniref:Bacterial sugar transferase domain-containing protein n=1 Tax=Paracraurococcus ruber TaxID=77675 RepID=A0ABS1D1S7_9PROT|nr:TIGR03013 family XrtA/PEP-CTERM system glycosyltransferase [Paracraurococcus ruber]MBK1660628.1 hypothetical protein [Paracraurococcus ruber]TDG27486.1 TIGR03013 family PEP-CTERM/XrtA system glycosyltransferase [Paracraurococcus ruber]